MEHGWVLRVWHDLFLIYRIPIERENAKEKAARKAWAKEQLKRRGHPDGRPATYDNGLDNEWNPSLGIRKGWAGRS